MTAPILLSFNDPGGPVLPGEALRVWFSHSEPAFLVRWCPRRRAFGRALHRARAKAGLPRTVRRGSSLWNRPPFVRLP